MTNATMNGKNIVIPARYPHLRVIVTESPPVSPSVVAAIFMIQKMSVTSGTLLNVPYVPRSSCNLLLFWGNR